HVKLRVEPGEPGSGCVVEFDKAILGDAIPERMIPYVEEGIAEWIDRGVLTGYPMDDIRVSVYDGSYNNVASSGAAFKSAGRLAFIEAARGARPILIEPLMMVSVETPFRYQSRVMDWLRPRRAGFLMRAQVIDSTDMLSISILAPLSQLFGFGTEL